MANHNRSGWISPHNKRLKSYNVHLKPDTLAAWKEAAALAGMSQRQAVEYVFRTFAHDMGVVVTPAPEQPAQPKPLTRLIVPPLD